MTDTEADDRVPVSSWPLCEHRSAESGSSCNGRKVDGYEHCLAHLEPGQLEQVLQGFSPGADLEAPGTDITAALLARILRTVAGERQAPRFGRIDLTRAHFTDDAVFHGVQFSGPTQFTAAKFSGDAKFNSATFSGKADFDDVQFSGGADFDHVEFKENVRFKDAQVTGRAGFDYATFNGFSNFIGAQFGRHAGFDAARFSRYASFTAAHFRGDAWFGDAQFSGDADLNASAAFDNTTFDGDVGFEGAIFSERVNFTEARFEKASLFGPLVTAELTLDGAVFGRPVMLQAIGATVTCVDTTWEAGVTMRLRYATVDLEGATFTVPSFVVGADQPFKHLGEERVEVGEGMSHDRGQRRAPDDLWIPTVLSLRGADTCNLSVTDVDLSQCRFAGARLLDQLRLEGRCIFDCPPEGIRAGLAWLPVWRWSSRQALAEERTWRAVTPKYSGWATNRSNEPAEVRPERLAGLYRQLRKAQEDAKNEPGAADFYYGEMEMRRHSRTTPGAERAIIWLYWLISGYGLRALRSLGALIIVGAVVTTALVGWGLAATEPPQHLTGIATTAPHNPTRINATISTTAPQLPPAGQRWTSQRTGTAVEVTLESMVFRSTNQPLTTAGTWTTIAARILGPVLLALALLAVRNRVKR